MNRNALKRSLVVIMLALLALGIAGHFVYDVRAATSAGSVSGERSRPIVPTGITCSALLHFACLLAPVALALSVPIFFWPWVTSHPEYRIWAPLTPFRPPIFA